MTIAMIGQKGLPARSGGIERHVELLSTGLASRGHRVLVYGRSWYVGGHSFARSGITQILTSGIKTKHLDAITHSFTALLDARRQQPDVVHIHGTGIALLTPFARLLIPKAKIIVTFHCIDRTLSKWGVIAKFAFHMGEWFACKTAHATIAVSQDLARYCMETYGTQTSYVPHAFPAPKSGSVELLADHGLTAEEYLLFVGRLIPDKQAHVLVRAFSKARKERPDLFGRLSLVIVGGASWTDRYASWLCKLAAAEPSVHLLGERTGSELGALQAHALAHVFPTSSEGLSVAVMEAAAFARPIVASDIEPNREATGGNMLAVAPGDVDALADALIELAMLPKSKRQTMGHAAQAHVRKEYHPEERVDDIVRVYQGILSGDLALVTPVAV